METDTVEEATSAPESNGLENAKEETKEEATSKKVNGTAENGDGAKVNEDVEMADAEEEDRKLKSDETAVVEEEEDKEEEESTKKTPKKKAVPPPKKGSARKSMGAETPGKNKLPPFKDMPVELSTKTIIIGKGGDYSCLLRSELTAIGEKEGKFGVGDIIWAKMTGFPWWPCMVANDPVSGQHSRISGVSYKADRVYHVQYFGAEPSRGWTTIGMVLAFEGYDGFSKMIDAELEKVTGNKNGIKKIHDKYAVKPSLANKWMESVCEAEKALKLSLETRVKLLTFQYSSSAPEKAPKTPKPKATPTPSKAKTPKESKVEAIKAEPSTPSATPKAKPARRPRKSAKKGSQDLDDSKDNVYDFDEDIDESEQTPFPTWTSRIPKNEEEKRKAIFEHEENLLIGKRPTFENLYDSDDSDEAYVDSNPASPVPKDEQDNDEEASESGPGVAAGGETPKSKSGRARKSAKKLDGADSATPAKKSLKKSSSSSSVATASAKKVSKKEPKDVEITEEISETDESEFQNGKRKWALEEDSDSTLSSTSEAVATAKKRTFDRICLKCGDEATPELKLTKCEGVCGALYHSECVKFVTQDEKKLCTECEANEHPCFACKDTENFDTMKCENKKCGRFYHLACISAHYPTKINESSNNFECPAHSCLTCFQNHLHFGSSKTEARQIISCIYCPASFHKNQTCIAAGTVELSRHYGICPDHYRTTKIKSTEDRCNINNCFSCLGGGSLVLCELCPAAFHEECLDYPVDMQKSFFCKGCVLKIPLHYGDVVWSKSGSYRWWPAQIVSPDDIPKSLLKSHKYGEFPVYFFGSHNYAWTTKGRTFLFDEADKPPKAGSSKKALTATFKKAFIEAQEAFAEAKKTKQIALQALTIKPPPYTQIQTNRYLVSKNGANKDKQIACHCAEKNQDCSDIFCLNRATRSECASNCPVGATCKNKRLTNRENAKVRTLKSTLHGWGLYAEQDIKKDQFVIEYCGEIIDAAECEKRCNESTKSTYYFLTIDKDQIIDAGPKGSLARFMNHSCEPNCVAEKWTINGQVRVGMFALKDIPNGAELTFDYQYELHPGQENVRCTCGAENCRQYVGRQQGQKRSSSDSPQPQSNAKNAKKRKTTTASAKENKKAPSDSHEDVCDKCGDDGKLIMCEHQDGCSKSYHIGCVDLEKIPKGTWICPSHDSSSNVTSNNNTNDKVTSDEKKDDD